jgi:hypothetical protein
MNLQPVAIGHIVLMAVPVGHTFLEQPGPLGPRTRRPSGEQTDHSEWRAEHLRVPLAPPRERLDKKIRKGTRGAAA